MIDLAGMMRYTYMLDSTARLTARQHSVVERSPENKDVNLKVKHQKIDCAFIFLAIFIVSGFALTITLYSGENFGFRVPDSVEESMDVPDASGSSDVSAALLNMVPSSYVLYVSVDMQKRTYNNVLRMNFAIKTPASRVIFHSSMHYIHSVVLKHKDQVIPVEKIYRVTTEEAVVLTVYNDLSPDTSYQLLVSTSSDLTYNTSRNIHLTTSRDDRGVTYEMLTTNFGYSGASEAWPCLDKPSSKAEWKIIVMHDMKYAAISNMPVQEVKSVEVNKVETYFAVTPKMSSNSVVLILTEYKYKEVSLSSKTKIRAYAPSPQLGGVKLALQYTSLVIEYYSRIFNTKAALSNPVKKFDIVPTDVKLRYSSSWGVVLIDEEIFYDSLASSSVFLTEELALSISKDVCLQFLGEVYERREILCNYFQTFPLFYYFPSWNINEWFFLNVVDPALAYDSNKYARSINAAPTAGKNKATALLANAVKYIGVDVFLSDMDKYLTQSRDNASKTWNTKSGFPLLNVSLSDKGLLIRQERFRFKYGSKACDKGAKDSPWEVRLAMSVCGKENKHVIDKKEVILPVDHSCDTSKPYYLDYNAFGFYRVNYDGENWMRILNTLNTDHKLLPAAYRASLLSNLRSLVKYGHVNVSLLLDFTAYLKKEHHFAPWKVAIDIFDEMFHVFHDTTVYDYMQIYTIILVTPVIDHLNSIKRHTHPQKKLISLLLSYAMRYRKDLFRPIRLRMQNGLLKWQLSNGKMPRVSGTTRNVISSVGIAIGCRLSGWNFVFRQFQKANSTTEKNFLLSLLSSTQNVAELRRLVRQRKDIISVLSYVCRNVKGKYIARAQIKTNWVISFRMYSAASLEPMLTACFGSATSNASLLSVKHLKASVPVDSRDLVHTLDRLIDDIEMNMFYRSKEKDILRWSEEKKHNRVSI